MILETYLRVLFLLWGFLGKVKFLHYYRYQLIIKVLPIFEIIRRENWCCKKQLQIFAPDGRAGITFRLPCCDCEQETFLFFLFGSFLFF